MPETLIARTAQEIFGWERLRDGQEESVSALLEGRDVLAVLPTGAGNPRSTSSAARCWRGSRSSCRR